VKIEAFVFYRVRGRNGDKVVLALRDSVDASLRFFDHMTAGLEESAVANPDDVLLTLGTAETFWQDAFASAVLNVLLEAHISLDALESVALVDLMRRREVSVANPDAIKSLAQMFVELRKELIKNRAAFWRALTE
jgi:hypothetical protein